MGRIAFAIKARPDEVTKRFSHLSSASAFPRLSRGRGGTATLAKPRRGQTVSHNERALDVVNRLGLHACFNLLLLNPDSTSGSGCNVAFLRRRPHNR